MRQKASGKGLFPEIGGPLNMLAVIELEEEEYSPAQTRARRTRTESGAQAVHEPSTIGHNVHALFAPSTKSGAQLTLDGTSWKKNVHDQDRTAMSKKQP
jgi:hypothetical protein